MKEIYGTPAPLSELIDYQPGSIVSKQIIKKNQGTVTLFAFDQGQSLSEHTAPFDALIFVVEGVSRITVAGVAHEVRAGETIMLPVNKRHAVDAVERFKMLLIMVKSAD